MSNKPAVMPQRFERVKTYLRLHLRLPWELPSWLKEKIAPVEEVTWLPREGVNYDEWDPWWTAKDWPAIERCINAGGHAVVTTWRVGDTNAVGGFRLEQPKTRFELWQVFLSGQAIAVRYP